MSLAKHSLHPKGTNQATMSEAVQRTYRPGKAPLSSGPLSTSISTDTAKYRIATVLPLLGDPDPRVRTTAIETLICEHDRDSITANALQASVYCRAREAVSDDNEMVRAQAIELVRVLGHRFPEKSVPPIDVSKGKKSGPGEDESRLANDAFAVLCGGVMDLSVRVRAKAARALGSIAADEHILVQTFDKKVMSHLRKKRTEHETMHLQQRRTGANCKTNVWRIVILHRSSTIFELMYDPSMLCACIESMLC